LIDARGATVLGPPECKRLLAMAATLERIGRIGVATDQAPVVVPVNFTVHDEEIHIRLGAGFISQSADGSLVAFEVDQVDSVNGWAWSVLVRGLATVMDSAVAEDLEAAGAPLVPEPGHLILVIRPDLLTGRHFTLGHHNGRAVRPPPRADGAFGTLGPVAPSWAAGPWK